MDSVMRRIDLHLHSNRSDGKLAPGEVLEGCAAAGLDLVALTDHDLLQDLDPGLHTFGSRQIRLIAGAEISGTHEGREFHLLVYFPSKAPASFRDLCTEQVQFRARRYDDAVATLGLSGVPPASEEARQGRKAMTRLHLAHATVDAGHATSTQDAFARLLSEHHRKVPQFDLPFVDAIRIAREAGAITSWAHPSVRHATAYLDTFVAAGLHGIEVVRPRVSRPDKKSLKKMAKRRGLLITGGSDFHGWYRERLGLFHVTPYDVQGFLDALAA